MSQPRPTSSLAALANAHLDTLATALYVKTDDLQKGITAARALAA